MSNTERFTSVIVSTYFEGFEHLVKLIDDHTHGKHFGRTTVSDDFPYAWPVAEL